MPGRREPVAIEPWGIGDRWLLARLVGDPAMMEHLGGAEGEAKIDERQERYSRVGSRQYRIVGAAGEPVGWVGYWERDWRELAVFEIGWSVLPERQGHGYASRGTTLALRAAAAEPERDRRYVHAFPDVANAPSNAVCRSCGFALLEAIDFEYPPGRPMRCHDWRYDLGAVDGHPSNARQAAT